VNGDVTVKSQLRPRMIITSSRANEELYDWLQMNDLPDQPPFNITTLKRLDFLYEISFTSLKYESFNSY
jgi:hypothetical protein